MKVGFSQVDITPAPGVELSGFAIRTQPSTGVLDRLFAKALYVEHDHERLLWVHCDLIGFDAELVAAFRQTAAQRCGIAASRIMLSATHTHSGPATLRLRECGEFDPMYSASLLEHLNRAAEAALARPETCHLVTAEAPLALAVDRRGKRDAHTDPIVGALGFRRADGTWAGIVVNHAMHPVALGAGNRSVSADVSGQVALALSSSLPGAPVVLVTNGACGNLNPPATNVSFSQVKMWGEQIAAAIAAPLHLASPRETPPRLRVEGRRVPLPIDVLTGDALDAYARLSLANASFQAHWGDRFRRAVEHWRDSTRTAEAKGPTRTTREIELMAIALGNVTFVGVNAEVFSRFATDVRSALGRTVYTVGYANGVLGYLPTSAAFVEGGYEPDAAHFFYGGFRYRIGALEQLTRQAVALVRELSVEKAIVA